MFRTRRILLSTYSLLLFSGVFCQVPKIVFTPHWLPQAQFAGYYMAQEKGFYLEEGLEVEIIHPSASVIATERLISEESDLISLFLLTALSARAAGVDLINIAQLSQNSALLFVAKKESGIQSLDDLNGKKIGIWKSGFDEVPKALIRSNNYQVNWTPILSSINLFMIGGVDAMTVMWYNEYDQIINAGINPDELTTFFFSEYGYNIPEDGIYCLSKTLKNRPDDLEKFVNGTLRGWEYAKTHQKETLEVILNLMKKNHIATNLAHQSWMLEKMLELVEPGTKKALKGELLETDFQNAVKVLSEGGYIATIPDFSEFYKPVLKKNQ